MNCVKRTRTNELTQAEKTMGGTAELEKDHENISAEFSSVSAGLYLPADNNKKVMALCVRKLKNQPQMPTGNAGTGEKV